MTRSKKWTALLLTLLMILNGISIHAFAAGESPVLLSAPESVLDGADVRVNVESTTNSVADGKLAMTYDADKLSFVGVDAGEAWTDEDDVVYSVNHTTGEVVFAFACEEAAVRGVLFTLTFTARAEGDATVTLNGANSYISGAGKVAEQTATIAVEPCVVPVGSYRVVFEQGDHGTMKDGETVVRDITVGETIGTLPEIVVDFGYVLTGWMIDGTLYTAEEVSAMSFGENEVVTIVAQYEFDAPAGTIPVVFTAGTNGSFVYGNSVTVNVSKNGKLSQAQLPMLSPKQGYRFAYWLCLTTNTVYSTDELLALTITDPLSFEAVFVLEMQPVIPNPPVNPNPPVDPKPPVDDPDDGKDDEQDKPGFDIEVPELTEEKYASIVAQYPDAKDHWAEESIVKAINAGLFNGTTDNTFSPNDPMTRAMLMTVLARLNGVDTTGGSPWYEKGMQWAKENGISDGSNPNNNITRQELVTMLYRFAGKPATNGSLAAFTDASSVADYAVDAMKWAVENGIINGMGDGTLAPKGEANRAQLAKILVLFIEL